MQEKTVKVTARVNGEIEEHVIELPGIPARERLTPKMAAQAAFIVFGHRVAVTVSDTVTIYMLYANSHRKLSIS